MRVGMTNMSATHRVNAHRALSLTVSFLALVGWGAFYYPMGATAVAQKAQLRTRACSSLNRI